MSSAQLCFKHSLGVMFCTAERGTCQSCRKPVAYTTHKYCTQCSNKSNCCMICGAIISFDTQICIQNIEDKKLDVAKQIERFPASTQYLNSIIGELDTLAKNLHDGKFTTLHDANLAASKILY